MFAKYNFPFQKKFLQISRIVKLYQSRSVNNYCSLLLNFMSHFCLVYAVKNSGRFGPNNEFTTRPRQVKINARIKWNEHTSYTLGSFTLES